MPSMAKTTRTGFFSGSSSGAPSKTNAGAGVLSHLFSITPMRATWGLFAIWTIALSGIFSDALHTPGIWQALKLRSLLQDKRAQIAKIQDEVRTLKVEIEMMDSSVAVQQREVRRVLGYAAPDELIFDFSAPERLE